MRDGSEFADIQAARAELDTVIQQVRGLPGYGGFLASPQFGDVARAAKQPMVYIVAAERGGFALVVHDAHVAHVPLDQLTDHQLQARATAYFGAYAEYQSNQKWLRAHWYAALDDLTNWLWDAVMGSVLASLPPATTRIAIVAGGFLGLLPLHVAWTSDASRPTGRRYALDDVAISYVPNARSFEVALGAAADVVPRRLLAVVEPLPVAASPLASAGTEALAAMAAFPDEQVILKGTAATPEAFERAAAQADVLHLACHGFADLERPLDGGVVLAGDQLVSLRHLIGRRLRIRLAVLSACETALPGAGLPDEVISLPVGMLQAGVAGVVASQWAVPDRATAMLMTEFYRCWRQRQMAPSESLREAQRWLRDSTNDEKSDHFAAAAAAGEEWLSATAAEDFLNLLNGRDPNSRDDASIHAWGAFAHFGA